MRVTPEMAAAIASNIVDGENPPYTCDDFRAIMPQFTEDIIADEQLEHFVRMANASVQKARWFDLWEEGMRLYIAHFVTLYLEEQPSGETKQDVVNAGKLRGGVTSKSVGQVSIAYDGGSQATSDLTGWAQFKLTHYGVQFASLARMVGMGGMYIR